MENWITGVLGDFITLQRGFDLPEYERHPGNIPVVTSSGISDFHDEAKVKAPGVVMGRYGTIGTIYFVEQDFWPHNTTLFVKDFKGNDPRFISYFLRTLNYQAHNDKSSVPGLNRNHLHLIPVKLPLPSKQRAIAEVLGSLDDKIELNRRMNQTLESLMQAVFRQWFIEGEKIEAWEVGKLGDVAENIRRSVNADDIDPKVHYIGLENMPRGSIALSEWGNSSELASNKFVFKKGEFLFGKLRPYFKKVGVAPVDGVCSTDILVISPKTPEWYGFVLGYITSPELINFTNAASTGTKMPRTNWEDIARYEVALPPRDKAREFNDFIQPIIHCIQSKIMESRTLAELRDSLLPKLLSGKVKVSDFGY